MPRNKALAWAAAACALWAAGPSRAAPGWKNDARAGLYRCEIPESWTAKSLRRPAPGAIYTDGQLAVEAMHFSGERSPYRSPRAYLDSLQDPGLTRGRTTVAGRGAERAWRQFEQSFGGEDSPAHSGWVYEELVLLPWGDGFWLLDFKSHSGLPQDKPRGLAAWRRFLASFQPD